MTRAAVAAVAAVVAAGCGGESASNPGTTTSATAVSAPVARIGAACLRSGEGERLRFRSGSGAKLAGVVLGHADRGVVFVHEDLGGVCEWLPYARRFARLGYSAMTFDLNGFGSSTRSPGSPNNARYDLDVAAAVGVLRGRGVKRIVLVGSSIGGTAALTAAASIRPPVAGVVDLSGPVLLSGLDALRAARRLTVPALFGNSKEDQYVSDTRAVYRAAHGNRKLVVVGGGSHGINLLDPARTPAAPRLRALVETFVHDHTAAD